MKVGAGRTAVLTAVTALSVVVVGGCSADTPSATTPPSSAPTSSTPPSESAEAVDAVADYRRKLTSWTARVKKDADTLEVTKFDDPRKPWVYPNYVDLLGRQPTLAAVEDAAAGGSYERAQQLEDRVDEVVEEWTMIETFRESKLDVYFSAYDVMLEYSTPALAIQGEYFDANYALYDEPDMALGLPGSRGFVQALSRNSEEKLRADAAVKRDLIDGFEALARKAPTPLGRSLLTFVATEHQWMVDFQREAIRQSTSLGPNTQVAFYMDRFNEIDMAVPAVTIRPVYLRESAPREFAEVLTGLAAAPDGVGDLPAGTPRVGDVYRAHIVDEIAPVAKVTIEQKQAVNTQLWMLYRIKELEDTPEGVYQDARQLVLTQNTADARSPYEDMVLVTAAFASLSELVDYPKPAALLPWAEDLLSRDVPDVLAPSQSEMLAVIQDADVSTFANAERVYVRLRAAARSAATALDDVKLMRAEIRKAVLATDA